MTDSPTSGRRLPLLRPQDLDLAQRALHTALSAAMVPWARKSGFQAATEHGELLGPFNLMLRSPGISAGLSAFTEAESKFTTLDARVRQVIILTVGAEWKAAYEIYAHKAVGRQAGLDEATVEALASGNTAPGLSPEEALAQEVTQTLCRSHRVSAELYGRGLTSFGEQGLVDLVMLAGHYMTISALLNTFDEPVPG